jgi:hypothetical protein
MTKAFVTALALIAFLGAAPTKARAQETAVRFPVTQVGDTTFAFRLGEHVWVRQGMRGIVVDPRQQDVLVARFRIMNVSGGQATALITGQTTAVSTNHSVLLEVPSRPWYRERTLWLGGAIGVALGFLLGSL